MLPDFHEIQAKDIELLKSNPSYIGLAPLKYCICGERPWIDASMDLIYCHGCGMSFEYRYNRGVVPYHMWQRLHT